MLAYVYRIASLLLISSLAMAQDDSSFLDEADISWKVNEFNVSRWKTLVGGSEGGQLNNEDIQFGRWQLAPGATYHGHKHEVPEVYYILGGEAEWTVGDETRTVTAGMTIYTKPGEVHKMVNRSDEPVDALWFWWAPDGEREVFSGAYEFTEPAPEPVPGFEDAEKLY